MMKRRLRKKKHLGEFKLLGVEILINLNSKDNYDRFHTGFILEAIEGNNCFFGGGGMADKLEGFIELGCVSDKPESRLKAITQWLDTRSDVSTFQIGRITDAWHGPFEHFTD
jgi:uncharacterized protein YggL (DUF469 family)